MTSTIGARLRERGAYVPPSGKVVFAPGETAIAQTPSLEEAGLGGGSLSIDLICSHLPFVDDFVSVFKSGSHALGWNHHRSDLDLYVVTKAPVAIDRGLASDLWHVDLDTDPPAVHLFLGALGPFRSDVEFWLESQIDQILEGLPYEGKVSDDIFNFSDAQRDFLHKLVVAVPLAGEAWLRKRQEAVRRSSTTRTVAIQSMVRAHSLLEDTEGCVSSGDLDSALLMVRQAFDWSVDALLASYGDIALTKWTARRVAAVEPAELPSGAYRKTATLEGYRDNPRQWILGTARTCHRILIAVTSRLDA